MVEPSGWAIAHNLSEKVNCAIVVITLYIFLSHTQQKLQISGRMTFGLALFFVIIPYFFFGSSQGFEYLSAFFVVFILSQAEITHKVVRMSALIYAALGLFILHTYKNGTALKGWNDNAIAMTGLFSFVYFSIFLVAIRNQISFWIFNAVSVVYLYYLFSTDCRSGMAFSIIAIVGIIFTQRTKSILSQRWINIIMLNVPLIIAAIVVILTQSETFKELNTWSIKEFNKPIFNGRDDLWKALFDQWPQLIIVGTAKFKANYHNSAVAAISVFGLIAYILWISYFATCMHRFRQYLYDKIVFGCMLAFLIIFMQQSFDLGFIGPTPNYIPYTILGIGLGRIRTLNDNSYYLKGEE